MSARSIAAGMACTSTSMQPHSTHSTGSCVGRQACGLVPCTSRCCNVHAPATESACPSLPRSPSLAPRPSQAESSGRCKHKLYINIKSASSLRACRRCTMVPASGLPSLRCCFLPWIHGCSSACCALGRCLGSLHVHACMHGVWMHVCGCGCMSVCDCKIASRQVRGGWAHSHRLLLHIMQVACAALSQVCAHQRLMQGDALGQELAHKVLCALRHILPRGTSELWLLSKDRLPQLQVQSVWWARWNLEVGQWGRYNGFVTFFAVGGRLACASACCRDAQTLTAHRCMGAGTCTAKLAWHVLTRAMLTHLRQSRILDILPVLKREACRQQLVGHHPRRPHIRLRVDLLVSAVKGAGRQWQTKLAQHTRQHRATTKTAACLPLLQGRPSYLNEQHASTSPPPLPAQRLWRHAAGRTLKTPRPLTGSSTLAPSGRAPPHL